jgi:hypothetical protein
MKKRQTMADFLAEINNLAVYYPREVQREIDRIISEQVDKMSLEEMLEYMSNLSKNMENAKN